MDYRGIILPTEVKLTFSSNHQAGGDTNGDGNATSPAPGDWGGQPHGVGLQFEATSSGSVLDQVVLRYTYQGIISFSSGLSIINSSISDCSGHGIWLEGASPTINGNTISNNGNFGIVMNSSSPTITNNIIANNGGGIAAGNSNPVITGNSIEGNSNYGIHNSDTSVVINAENNWWGHESGPLDDSDDRSIGGFYNPYGLGDKVSDHVDYVPWIGMTTNNPPVADPNGPYSGSIGISVMFDGSGSYDLDGTIVSYDWNFGDGSTGTGANPTHTYAADGTYTVILAVTDDYGETTSASTTAEIIEQDFGDAPDPNYQTLLANNGARHTLSDLYLGASVDSEIDGQPDANATGDDTAASDDEDGVTFTTTLVSGDIAQIEIFASAEGKIDAWIDYNGDGDWSDAGEQIFSNEPVLAGTNSRSLTVPLDATPGDTFARFRISSSGGLSFDGSASDGEVEDYMIEITAANEPPVADAGGPYTVDEGNTVTLDASGSHDPDANIVLYEWDLDNDNEYDDAIGETTTTVFNDNGVYTVGLKVTDSYGEYDTNTATIIVNDLSPTAALTGDTVLVEGQAGSYDASGSTSSPDAIVSYEWDWDYNGVTFNPSGDTGVTQSHTWNDDGTYTAAEKVTDDDGSTDIGTIAVTVGNLPPRVNAGPDQTVNLGDTISVNARFTDPGLLDTHTAIIYWGDDSSDTGILTEPDGDSSRYSGDVEAVHRVRRPKLHS